MAKAAICVTASSRKKTQKRAVAGRRKYRANRAKVSSGRPCFPRKTRAQVGTWKPQAPKIR